MVHALRVGIVLWSVCTGFSVLGQTTFYILTAAVRYEVFRHLSRYYFLTCQVFEELGKIGCVILPLDDCNVGVSREMICECTEAHISFCAPGQIST